MDVRFVFDEIDLIQNYIWFLCRLPRTIVQTWKVSGPCWFMSPAIKKMIYLPHIYRLHCVVVYVCNQHSNAEVMKLAMLWVLESHLCTSPIWMIFWKFSNGRGGGGGFSIPKKYISGGSIHINSLIFIFFFWTKCCLITFANFAIFSLKLQKDGQHAVSLCQGITEWKQKRALVPWTKTFCQPRNWVALPRLSLWF